jgi:phosphate transport system substrate-binding protein
VLVQGVLQDQYALGYFGYAYYAENSDKVKAVPIIGKEGAAAVGPSAEAVIDGSYTPLARPLFVYVSEKSYAKPEVKAYIDFMLVEAPKLVSEVKFVPLPAAAYETAQKHLSEGKLGTVFGGVPETGVTIEALLAREASL